MELTTLQKKIIKEYQRGAYSIQDIARLNGVEVDDVLRLTGHADMLSITFIGDLVDDAGPNVEIRASNPYKQNYTKD